MQRRFPILGLLALSLLITAGAVADDGRFVRVPQTGVAPLDALGVQPLRALDYGSYLWLEVTAADLARLEAAGVAHVPMPEAGQVRVPNFVFDPIRDGEPTLPPELTGDGEGDRLRLVQLVGPPPGPDHHGARLDDRFDPLRQRR